MLGLRAGSVWDMCGRTQGCRQVREVGLCRSWSVSGCFFHGHGMQMDGSQGVGHVWPGWLHERRVFEAPGCMTARGGRSVQMASLDLA